jgi:type II secretory pathway component PulC
MEAGGSKIVVRFDSSAVLVEGVQAGLRGIYRDQVIFSWAGKPSVTLNDTSGDTLDAARRFVGALHQMLTDKNED